ncbi:OsmC family protein [Virgibacillus soli]|uniref:OsmC family protein n=1 Tax=Paracerasibacillus soli TaxID=480284 RepID=A0ABU5CNW0_9BACI|nr:OsmC family protein [Virgibacillus soli]MDY0407532.1 OsmC family protein [Virgibacillus soli]
MKFQLTEHGVSTEFDFGKLDISGDAQYGFRPFQLMVASIVGCSTSVFRKILVKQRIDIEDIICEAEVKRNPNEANKIEEIMLTYYVKGQQLKEEKLQKSLAIARKNCAMVRSVEDSITINETIIIVSK